MLRRLNSKNTALFICDIQEIFRNVMPLYPPLIANTLKMIKGANAFGMKIYFTEQYPEKLGKTVPELEVDTYARCVFPKTRFSMFIPELEMLLHEDYEHGLEDILLCGLETHVCVEQTCMDLLQNKKRVWLLADCICSRLRQERDLAFRRLERAGVILSSVEEVLFNILCDKNNPNFKDIAKLVKDPSCDMDLC